MAKQEYCPEYDAAYDVKTGEWLEEKCDVDPCDSDYCNRRPEKHEYNCQCFYQEIENQIFLGIGPECEDWNNEEEGP